MGTAATPHRRRAAAAFTLIEIMAVVVLFALFAAIVAPRVAAIGGRELRQRAEDIAAQLELARQRSVVTGVRHRVWFDLEAQRYRVEWMPAPPEEPSEAPARVRPSLADLRNPGFALPEQAPLSLSPPAEVEREWQPVPGESGGVARLEDSLRFEGVETPEGWIDVGDAAVDFETDGTATPAQIHLVDEDGRGIVLEVLPLAEGVRIGDGRDAG
jgi:prepilin-type N-terminal cleavage/methylation domain-containing protein